MSECANELEFDKKFRLNSKITVTGGLATAHYACPFCAEPGFMVFLIADTEAMFARGARCTHCGRGLRRITNAEKIGWTTEFVQTCGPDAPSWQRPIRREQ